jgi:hypothetical protein
MKMILIAAATLMTGASVYGVIDYKKRSGTKEFENLYREEKTTNVVPAALPVVKNNDVKAESSELTVKEEVKKKPAVKKSHSKKRKISYKTFSRAEPVVVEEEKVKE